jgi:4-hydroxybenzoate polyprenyltransferase
LSLTVNRLRALLIAMRPHQWSKNLLLAIPPVFAQVWAEPQVIYSVSLAFLAFCLAASGGYIINDLIDVEADRRHPEKRHRPFASGELSPLFGTLWGPVLLAAGIGLGFVAVNRSVGIIVTAYVVLSVVYSAYIKSRLLWDVILLAALYTLRLLAGSAAAEVETSSWLLGFSMFFFLSLAFAKRFVEFDTAKSARSPESPRPYREIDLDAFRTMGPTSGLLSILVLALYINSDLVTKAYGNPKYLWLLCPLLTYWILRIWMITLRGELHHDPIVFALRDRASYAVVACIALVLYLAVR